MFIYDNLLGAYINILHRHKHSDAFFVSILLTSVSAFIHLMTIIGIIQLAFSISILQTFRVPKYYYIIFALPWIVLSILYYHKKTSKIYSLFLQKTSASKKLWQIIAIGTLLFAIIGFPVIFSKGKFI